ncbi:MAG: hypothetical protein IJ647_10240 [Prevotella sp.]|nr:hypothetical protein [Prevotella sp.]
MKIRYKKRNSPRLESTIKCVLHATQECYGGWYGGACRPKDLGMKIIEIAYGADKYDVLNKLCCPYKRGIVSYVRCDIRHRSRLLDVLLLLLLLTFIWLISQPVMFAITGISQTSDILLIG